MPLLKSDSYLERCPLPGARSASRKRSRAPACGSVTLASGGDPKTGKKHEERHENEPGCRFMLPDLHRSSPDNRSAGNQKVVVPSIVLAHPCSKSSFHLSRWKLDYRSRCLCGSASRLIGSKNPRVAQEPAFHFSAGRNGRWVVCNSSWR